MYSSDTLLDILKFQELLRLNYGIQCIIGNGHMRTPVPCFKLSYVAKTHFVRANENAPFW